MAYAGRTLKASPAEASVPRRRPLQLASTAVTLQSAPDTELGGIARRRRRRGSPASGAEGRRPSPRSATVHSLRPDLAMPGFRLVTAGDEIDSAGGRAAIVFMRRPIGQVQGRSTRRHRRGRNVTVTVTANLDKLLDKTYEGKDLRELVDAPPALAGVSDGDARPSRTRSTSRPSDTSAATSTSGPPPHWSSSPTASSSHSGTSHARAWLPPPCDR
jgi:hypothetical protein